MEKFLTILKDEKVYEIVPFLKSLTEAERRTLVPALKLQIKQLLYSPKGDGVVGTNNQFVIASIAAFVCFDYKEFIRNRIMISYLSDGFIKFHEYSQKKLIDDIRIDDIMEWYCPKWLGDFLNNINVNSDYRTASYSEIMRWYEKGYIAVLSPELIVSTLSRAPFESEYKGHKMHYYFFPERLLEFPVTLKEHIPLLFRYQSDISYTYLGGGSPDNSWTWIFQNFIEQGHLERKMILRECLLVANNNLNKPLTNYFVDLFSLLNPTDEELKELQGELLSVLNSLQSKVQNNAIACLKRICADKSFDEDTFLFYLPVLLASPTKSVVKGMLDIAGTLLKNNSTNRDAICTALCSGFINKDNAIQTKIAKLIVQYGNPALLKNELGVYSGNILIAVKPLLKSFPVFEGSKDLTETISGTHPKTFSDTSGETSVVVRQAIIREENRIDGIETWEDFLFFATQVFDNREPWHCFLLPEYVQKFYEQITSENIVQMEPLFKSAVKVADKWCWEIGMFDKLFAAFFISFGEILLAKFPDASSGLNKLYEDKPAGLISWDSSLKRYTEFTPYYFILLKTLDYIRKGEVFHILSTPTHAPLRIDPVVLVRRLKQYDNNNQIPLGIDLQLAMQRCAMDDTSEALLLAKEQLKGELRELMVFLFDKEVKAPVNVEHPAWWMTAAIVKNPHTVPSEKKAWGFEHFPDIFITGNFLWEHDNNSLSFHIKLPVYTLKTNSSYFAEYISARMRNYSFWGADLVRHILSSPYNHQAVIAEALFNKNRFSKTEEKQALMAILRALFILQLPFSDEDYLALGLSLLSSDSEVRDFAAEVWHSGCFKVIDNEVLGGYVGLLTKKPGLPLKRFTDLLDNRLMNISKEHNSELKRLLSAILSKLEGPVTNKKKLEDIYKELCG